MRTTKSTLFPGKPIFNNRTQQYHARVPDPGLTDNSIHTPNKFVGVVFLFRLPPPRDMHLHPNPPTKGGGGLLKESHVVIVNI